MYDCPGVRSGYCAHPVAHRGKRGPGSRPVPEPAGQLGQIFDFFAQQTIAAALFFDDAGSEFIDRIVRMRLHLDLHLESSPRRRGPAPCAEKLMRSVLGLGSRLAQEIREIRRGQARMRWCFSLRRALL